MKHTLDLSDALEKLYGNHAFELHQKIINLVEKYRKLIRVNRHPLTQKDVVLITYANTLYRDGEKPLKTLKVFLDGMLKGLINSVHILPFYPFSSDDGFSVLDYFEVNPDFGSWQDIESLSHDYRLMFDAVVNHISKNSDWFQKFLNGNSEFQHFFIEVDENAPELKQVFRPRALPLVHKYETPFGDDKSVWTTFSEDQIDLNFSNPDIFLVVLEVLLFYVSKGARLIRLDAVGFLWKKLGTTCINLPETHLLIQLYREIIETLASDVLIITETNVPHKENISYFGNGHNEAHMVYNFTLPPLLAFSVITQNILKLANWLSELELPGNQSCYFNFTASHDGIGLQPVKGILNESEIAKLEEQAKNRSGYVSYKTNDDGAQSPYELNCTYLDLVTEPGDSDELMARKFMLTQAVMLTIPGVPGVYIHSLLGTQNDIESAEISGIHRRINRSKLEINQLMVEINRKDNLRNHVFSAYKKLLKIRTSEPFFDPFLSFDVNVLNSKLLSIRKPKGKDDFWAIFNFSSRKQKVKLNNSRTYINLLNKELQSVDPIILEPFGFCWLKVS